MTQEIIKVNELPHPFKYVVVQYNLMKLNGIFEWSFDNLKNAKALCIALQKQKETSGIDSFLNKSDATFYIYELKESVHDNN